MLVTGRSAVWLAHLHGVQGVGGSNPLVPTICCIVLVFISLSLSTIFPFLLSTVTRTVDNSFARFLSMVALAESFHRICLCELLSPSPHCSIVHNVHAVGAIFTVIGVNCRWRWRLLRARDSLLRHAQHFSN